MEGVRECESMSMVCEGGGLGVIESMGVRV